MKKILFCAFALMLATGCAAQQKTVKRAVVKEDDGTVITSSSIKVNGKEKNVITVTVDNSGKNKNTYSFVTVGGDNLIAAKLPVLSADSMPQYPGGMSAMMAYMMDNMRYPEDAKKAQQEGRVLCSFVVDETGKVTDVHVVQSSGIQSLDDEAVRIVRSMPDWTPGTNDGEPVSVLFTIPVQFWLR